ncbi:MAG TPA: S9 family peptidase [Caldimonas sp.]|jgi:dipeptidyl aminopeptidase/acylaminoacyl peptidase|nr:S9 family peptidase [Caldimonas sp.]HEX2539532.1 S9 family peptidase [Caldimonas sp.]
MPQPFTFDDLYLHRKISALSCVPSADRAVCSVKSVDRESDGYRTHLWQFALDGSGGAVLDCSEGSDSSPRWSPQGDRIAFLSGRGGGATQVFVAPADGSTAEQVGRFAESVMNLRWMPDGSGLVVTSAVSVDPDLRGRRSSRPPPKRTSSAAEVVWRLPYKEDGIGYLLKREIHLFALDLATGQERRLSDGPFDVFGFDVSADGRRVAYTRTGEGRYAHRYDLWICDLEDGTHRRLTFGHAMVMQPTWSPDGAHIAFTGAIEEGDAESRLWLVDCASGQVDELGGDDIDVADPQSLHWAADGRSIVFARAWRGRHQVVSIGVPDGRTTVLVGGDRQLGAFGCTGRRLAYSIEHPSMPSELWASDADGSGEARLSNLNPWWADRPAIRLEARQFDVPNGKGGTERIEGWLLQAEAQDDDKPGPLLNDAHGGPAAYALLDFDSNVFWQVLCCRGWRVLALNAVGSATYGREFCQRLAGHWGEYDLPQHLAAVRQLQAEGVCDERVAISGKSYGGYLSSWATGHSDVFKAAVVMAPVGNIETHYGTSDGGYYADPFYVASKPRFDRRVARELSPLQYIEASTTPTLFLQGKDDERCPKCQSEELFVSLYRAGDTPAELVLYPGETHSFLGSGTPSCREDAAERIFEWLERHAGATAAPPIERPTTEEAVA